MAAMSVTGPPQLEQAAMSILNTAQKEIREYAKVIGEKIVAE